jgi:hypothetical protein
MPLLRKRLRGFAIAGAHTPGALKDFVRVVVPEPQRRGVCQKEYPEGM